MIAVLGASAWVLLAGYQLARRRGGDGIEATMHAIVLFYLAQYLAVGIAGLLGVLYGPVMLLIGAAIGAGFWVATKFCTAPQPPVPLPSGVRWTLAACLTVVLAYILGVMWIQREAPPLANDALTYHLPVAVDWLQHHRLTLYQTWLYNPANTYSPLAGSIFITWLMAPLGNDVLAKFVQAPALLLIFFALIQIGRNLGARSGIAILIATVAVLSQPFIRQIMLAKDDLFVAAFFATAAASLAGRGMRAEDRISRGGSRRFFCPVPSAFCAFHTAAISIGLLLATKYTAIFSLPLLLLMIELRPDRRRRARETLILVLVPLLLAGPWYLRNVILTGNPIYPLGSLLSTARSQNLRTLGGIWHALAGGYYSMNPFLWAGWIIGWLVVIVRYHREILPEPLLRTCVIGPIIGIGIFLLSSPYDEIRFINPSLILLMACSAIAFRGLLAAELVWCGLLLSASLATNFAPEAQATIMPGVIVLLAVGAIIVVSAASLKRDQRVVRAAGLLVALLGGAFLYVKWDAYLEACRRNSITGWTHPASRYMPLAQGWEYVRLNIPADKTIAYANTYFVYPLYGFELDRRVVYVPLRADLKQISDLPWLGNRLSGERIEPAVVRATIADPDRDAWMRRLREAGADYLFISRRSLTESTQTDTPPELTFAEQEPGRFRQVFENPEAVIYRIVP